VNEYLTIKDLSNLSKVNSQFYDFVDTDRVWEYHFEKTWKKVYQENNLNNVSDDTPMKKCLSAYKYEKTQ